MEKKLTIKDIAKMANVSAGTVDRVIHKRGNVSKASYDKVQKVLSSIDFQPNLIAKTLKNSKIYRLAALIPDYQKDIYWEQPTLGIEKAWKELREFGITVKVFAYNNFDERSFESEAQSILAYQPDGVLIAPLFLHQSITLIKEFKNRGIPCISFNTFIEESEGTCFIGQNLFRSGRLAAHLMQISQREPGRILVFHIDEDIENSRNMQDKESGFRQYFLESNDGMNVIEMVRIKFNDDQNDEEEMRSLLVSKGMVSGIFVTTSKVHKIAQFTRKLGLNPIIIGYDLIDENLNFLESGEIDFLINQNPQTQAYLGISYLTDHLVFGKEITKEKLLPIDIVTRENVEFYIKERN